MNEHIFQYFAFISYNSKDLKWGKRLYRRLEKYKLSTTLCNKYGMKERKPFKPIFFAPYEIQPGELSEELKQRLRESKYLIVICSPNSAKSDWVAKEIAYFVSLGRKDYIQFFIVNGEPHSSNPDKECFNPIIKELELGDILGANIHEKVYSFPWLNRERAYIMLITKLLGIQFDEVWNRHKRLLLEQFIIRIILFIAFVISLIGTWLYNQPQIVEVSLQDVTENNHNLPPLHNGIFSIQIGDSTQQYTFIDEKHIVTIQNVPRKNMNENSHITFKAEGYKPIDTIIIMKNKIYLPIIRDNTYYGYIHGEVWNMHTDKKLCNEMIQLEDSIVKTNSEGILSVLFPIKKQKKYYNIYIDNKFVGTIFMPQGNNTNIIINKEK